MMSPRTPWLLSLVLVVLGWSVLPVTGTQTAAAQPLADTSLTGTWLGTLSVPDGDFRVVLHLKRADDGALTGTMDSPDQGATGIPVSEVIQSGDTLRIGVQAISGRFAGVVGPQRSTVDGQWAQGPARLPLTLRRVDTAPTVARPQEPQPPLPYDVEGVRFENTNGTVLEGTLTRPRGAGPFPAVLLIAGAGAQDRDASVSGHRPFLVWADRLTRAGFSVLRYDERGVGDSEGQQQGATTAALSNDADAALKLLTSRDDIDDRRIVLVGHSEGGTIATMTAQRTGGAAAVVLLAAPAVPGDDILADQLEMRAEANDIDARTRAMQRGTQDRIFRALKQDADSAAVAETLRAILIDAQGIDGEEMIQQEVRRLTAPWLRAFVRYDPQPALQRLDVPVLGVFGARDTQIDAAKNAEALRSALDGGAAPTSTVRVFDGLNHLLQPASTGRPSEYGRIETTVSPQALDLVTEWLQTQL